MNSSQILLGPAAGGKKLANFNLIVSFASAGTGPIECAIAINNKQIIPIRNALILLFI
jgi:hypothetical protein